MKYKNQVMRVLKKIIEFHSLLFFTVSAGFAHLILIPALSCFLSIVTEILFFINLRAP